MPESNEPPENDEGLSAEEYVSKFLTSAHDKDEAEKNALAIDIAGRYLKIAAIKWAKKEMEKLVSYDNDDKLARIETMLRAARRIRRKSEHNGDPIPSIQQADRSRISPITHLIEIMGRDLVILADELDELNSKSKANRAIREAREKIKEVAAQIIGEGEIVA